MILHSEKRGKSGSPVLGIEAKYWDCPSEGHQMRNTSKSME